MRSLVEVVDKMLPLIPENEEKLINDLTVMQRSAMVAAPEMMSYWWQTGADTLAERFGRIPPKNGWGLKILNIWMDKV